MGSLNPDKCKLRNSTWIDFRCLRRREMMPLNATSPPGMAPDRGNSVILLDELIRGGYLLSKFAMNIAATRKLPPKEMNFGLEKERCDTGFGFER
uniref:Uncharacterized protein n=1 Tax=Salix viminalis TaxID=40686 RepID=A0A6N2K658_SALVM